MASVVAVNLQLAVQSAKLETGSRHPHKEVQLDLLLLSGPFRVTVVHIILSTRQIHDYAFHGQSPLSHSIHLRSLA